MRGHVSPVGPYWGLRDYGTPPLVWGGDAVCLHEWDDTETSSQRNRNGQGGALEGGDGPEMLHPSTGATCLRCGSWRGSLGLEPTPTLYVEHLVEIFRLVRDVLADDGVVFCNLGDSFATDKTSGLKPKDLCMIPARVALALQADGWWIRSDIIWAKPNPMPESVTDRPTKAHEYLFLLTKRATYFYDNEAIREPVSPNWSPDHAPTVNELGAHVLTDGQRGHQRRLAYANPKGANRRSVWTIATTPFPMAHFAVMPEDLVKPCILAGTSARGCCPRCGRQWERVVERTAVVDPGRSEDAKRYDNDDRNDNRRRLGQAYQDQLTANPPTTTGWQPGCACGLEPVPARVLDPFMGSGTVAKVAQDLGRQWLGCELSEAYAPMSEKRTRQQGLAL